jgi:hypothetical protein
MLRLDKIIKPWSEAGSPSHRYHLALSRVGVVADDRLHAGWRDVVGGGRLQGQVLEDAKVERLGDSLFVRPTEIPAAHTCSRLRLNLALHEIFEL